MSINPNTPANFTPTLSGYSGQHPFRFWCQKVLPLVYDDSLSYYELLNKVVAYLNNTISDVASVEDNVAAVLNSFNQLQEYVNTYFETLDILPEVEQALDNMVTDGTLGEVIEPYITAYLNNNVSDMVESYLPDVVESQIDDAVASQIGEAVSEQIGEAASPAVTAWLNANVDPVGSAVVVDSSLTIEGAAADAKVTGDKINKIITKTTNEQEYDFGNAVTNHYYIATSSPSVWATGSTSYGYIFPVNANAISAIITAGNTPAGYAFLKSNSQASGELVDYCNNTTRKSLSANTSVEEIIPDDCNYIWVLKTYQATSYEPDEFAWKAVERDYIKYTEQSLTNDQKAQGRENIDAADNETVNNIKNKLFTNEEYDFGNAVTNHYYIPTSSPNTWANSERGNGYIFPVNKKAESVSITAGEESTIYAFLKSNSQANYEPIDYCNNTGRKTVSANGYVEEKIPDDCNYIWVLKTYDGVSYEPNEFVWSDIFNVAYTKIPLGLHEMPTDENALNIVKRCRQLTDVKWVPALDVPRVMMVGKDASVTPETAEAQWYLSEFKANDEYKGIPYGQTTLTASNYGYTHLTVGSDIDLVTFISSISNPKSKLCNVYSPVANSSTHRSILYSTVCSGLTCYALGVREVPTAQIGSISGLRRIGKLNDNNLLLDDAEIKIGDVLNYAGSHTGVITDILRDSNGMIYTIEVSEATVVGLADKTYKYDGVGGICRRVAWSRNDLYYGRWKNYTVHRYTGEVPYTQSDYVNTGEEMDMYRVVHFPIMPYEGERFKYKDGYIPDNHVTLVITLDGYNYVKVFKDNVEITGSPFTVTVDSGTNEIENINITEIGLGNYTAYLCNIEDENVINLTYPCHWSIE